MRKFAIYFLSLFFIFQTSLLSYSSNPKDFVEELINDSLAKLSDKNLNKDQKKRHNVKPGITGLAQIMGRNNISWKQKFDFDIEYVRKQYFFLDVNIILKSISKVIFAHGINSSDNKPIEPFNGKN